jgi:hypothetical protein
LEALRLQIIRLQQREVFLGPVCERIGQRISETVLDVLDPDLRPPTDAQVKYALDIARELSVNLPGEALQYRGAMGEFIDRYQSLFYSRMCMYRMLQAGGAPRRISDQAAGWWQGLARIHQFN